MTTGAAFSSQRVHTGPQLIFGLAVACADKVQSGMNMWAQPDLEAAWEMSTLLRTEDEDQSQLNRVVFLQDIDATLSVL